MKLFVFFACGGYQTDLRHHTSNTLQIRYKGEDGDYVNLNMDNTNNFQEMFV